MPKDEHKKWRELEVWRIQIKTEGLKFKPALNAGMTGNKLKLFKEFAKTSQENISLWENCVPTGIVCQINSFKKSARLTDSQLEI